jgi:hypothetical protein
MGGFTPKLRLDVLWTYLLGGAACLYIISLWASLCYAALWSNTNVWQRKQYGRFRTTNSIAVAIAIFAIFAALVVMGALCLNLFMPKMAKIELVLWGVGMLLSFIVIALESAGVDYTVYGDTGVCDKTAYYSNDDFKEYVDKYLTLEWERAGGFQRYAQWDFSIVRNAVRRGGRPSESELWSVSDSPGVFDDPFLVRYTTCTPSAAPTVEPDGGPVTDDEDSFKVPSCVFNWTRLQENG